jgi:hypothetical protein
MTIVIGRSGKFCARTDVQASAANAIAISNFIFI